MTRLTAGLDKALLLLLTLALLSCAASAAGAGTLHVINATGVAKNDTATVSFVLTNDYNPKLGSLGLKIYYDSAVATAVSVTSPVDFTLPLGDLSSPITIGGATQKGVENGDPIIVNVTFQSMQDDGNATDIGLCVESAYDISLPRAAPLIVSVVNGTFTTKDNVSPVINVATKSPVSSTITIAGTIYDVGGMVGGQSKAQATLKNTTEVVVPLSLGGQAPHYTFSSNPINWPAGETITLTVEATDAAGNNNSTEPLTLQVVDVGFSDPEPADGSYIKAIPEYVRAVPTAIKPGSVQMYLGSAGTAPINLNPTIDNVYVRNTTPLGDLASGEYWVNVSGTGIDSIGGAWSLNWSFTLDTKAPAINTFTIADSDGDGYIEAGEDLYLTWDVTDPNFDNVTLVDVATGERFWSSTEGSGNNVKVTPITVGNRNLAFRAYDKAGNYDSRGFHLYYDYMVWVNSTKMDEVVGINTTYTAVKDISRTTVSSITLYGCTVTLPALNQLQKNVTNVGQVTNDTYVTVDKNANKTISGSDTYRQAWVLDPPQVGKNLDFQVKVPYARNATLVLAEANETYIAELIKGGKGGMHSVNYTELIKKTAYIFIEGGWKQVEVADDGTVSEKGSSGRPVTGQTIDAVLRHPANQVNLDGAGYRLSTQGLEAIRLAPGDYALAAIAMDGDRLGVLAAMPVVVMESETQGWLSADSVVQGGNITARFATPCERLGVVVLRDVAYDGNALIDAATLGKETLHLNLTYNGIPATQKLIGNVYVSPSSGKYAVSNTNQTTFSTSGLEPGTYRVYMIGQSAKGTVQAYGQHPLNITPVVETGSIAVTSVPTGAAIYLDGAVTGVVTNGNLTGVPVGKHTVKVTLSGYEDATSEVTVVANQTATVNFALNPIRRSGGGGSSGSTTASYTGTGTLLTGSSGTVLKSIIVNANDNIGSVLVPIGTKALDADGKPLGEITLKPLAGDAVPAVPSGSVFRFAGYAYEASPDGATFSPGITLSLSIPEDVWNSLDLTNQQCVMKWYNKETGLWEDVPTTVIPGTRTVEIRVTHFSIYALFTEPVTTPTPTETATTTPTTTTTTPSGDQPAEGLPMMMILAIFAVIAIIVVAGYFLMMRK